MKLIKYQKRCLSFLDDVKLWRRWGLASMEKHVVTTLFQTRVLPEISLLQNDDSSSARYPWCFVAPYRHRNGTRYFYGAFLPAQSANQKPGVILYTSIKADSWSREMVDSVSLSFWLARALAGIADRTLTHGNKVSLREACRPLAGTLAARQRCYIWLSEPRCNADFEFECDNGVDLMPWAGWPHCIQDDDNIWLWRKTRHGKIIDSIKIPTIRDLTSSV